MKRNNFFSRFIVVTLTAALLLVTGGRAIPVSALAVGPIADPVYDTEIFAFKDYVEQNLDNPQLDIMYFLIGGLAVAQLGAQDAQLITPYPNEENVKEWLINCGLQLYNSVIGLVPSGDYYMGIPLIGSAGTKGVPRQIIKALVAQMMGDAVVAINYRDLDEFLDENPNEIFVPFNPDLQLGVNAVFGLNGGAYDWQLSKSPWSSNFTWKQPQGSGTLLTEYNQKVSELPTPRVLCNSNDSALSGTICYSPYILSDIDMFIDTQHHIVKLLNLYDVQNCNAVFIANDNVYTANPALDYNEQQYIASNFDTYKDIVQYYLNHNTYRNSDCLLYFAYYPSQSYYFNLAPYIHNVYVGPTLETATLLENVTDLNYNIDNIEYYNQLTNDYLLDIRGLIGDLVNYVYVRNPVFDNIYDDEGNNIVPVLVKISTQLQDITELIAPPVPVNLNDIAELTDNTYLERVKEHARNAGDIFANYVAFWHNCDSDLVYTVFGAAILVLVGAFVGKWGHS